MKYPVSPVVLPKDLRATPNGKLSRLQLRKIKPQGGYLYKSVAPHWEAMRKAAKKDGVNLTHVGAYRTYEEQVRLFAVRFSKDPTGDKRGITRRWHGQTWYLRRGMAPVAVPGTSNHGFGIAIDCALLVGREVLPITANPDGKGGWASGVDWLLRNAHRFGFTWEIADGPGAEPWHIRYVLGDAPPPYTL